MTNRFLRPKYSYVFYQEELHRRADVSNRRYKVTTRQFLLLTRLFDEILQEQARLSFLVIVRKELEQVFFVSAFNGF